MGIRSTAVMACDVAIAALAIAIVFMIVGPLVEEEQRRECRLTFKTVEQHPILTDVCKDARARRAIIMWAEVDRVARGM